MPKIRTKLTGDDVERELKILLKKRFKLFEGPPVKTKFGRRDYFGLFDFIVINDRNEFIGIQVSKKYLSSRDKEFKESWSKWPTKKIFIRALLNKQGKLETKETFYP